MAFENIIGQARLKIILSRVLESKRIPHAFLFYGLEGVGKEAMALELAKALICQQDQHFACGKCNDCRRIGLLTHPDVIFIFPATKKATPAENQEVIQSIVKNPYLRLNPYANPSISIDEIRELKRTSALTSFENKGRVVIIAEAQRMTVEAENSLLKILDEPTGKLTLILTSSQPNLLLPTIVSRCQLYGFSPIPWGEIESALVTGLKIDAARARLMAKLSFGSYRRAIELLDENLDQKREKVLNILRIILRKDEDRLVLMENLVRAEDKKSIKDLLKLMLLWMRDALIYTHGNKDQSLIVNIDQLETLDKFCNSFEEIDFETIIGEIEKAIELFERNVFVNLILMNLFYSLKNNLRRKMNA
jgi:DNA polymerase-3 subunit delta'